MRNNRKYFSEKVNSYVRVGRKNNKYVVIKIKRIINFTNASASEVNRNTKPMVVLIKTDLLHIIMILI